MIRKALRPQPCFWRSLPAAVRAKPSRTHGDRAASSRSRPSAPLTSWRSRNSANRRSSSIPGYIEGTDSKYLLSTIRDRFLRHGAALVDNKAQADLVVEPRIGAISIDRNKTTFGTSKFDLPIRSPAT